jgi:hypothetical protein
MKRWKPPQLRVQTFEQFHDPSTHTKAASRKLYERGLPDFSSGLEYTFSERAKEVLSPLFLPSGEFLPVKLVGDKRKWFYYHCFKLCDALDIRSSFVSLPDDEPMTRNVHVMGYAFHAKQLAGYDVFRLTYLSSRTLVYVSKKVLDVATDAGLTGFKCVELWRSNDEPPIPRSSEDRKWIEKKRKEKAAARAARAN